jgi:hypothetical protein
VTSGIPCLEIKYTCNRNGWAKQNEAGRRKRLAGIIGLTMGSTAKMGLGLINDFDDGNLMDCDFMGLHRFPVSFWSIEERS